MPKDAEINDLISKKKWHAERKKLRSLIIGCDLVEDVKWGKLCYSHEGGNVVIIYGMKNYCALGFFKGSLLDDKNNVLVQPGAHSQAMRQLRFESLGEIDANEGQITDIIKLAIQVEKDGLEIDFDEKDNLEIPVELQKALNNDAELADGFANLIPGRQRGYVLHISDAKQSETRNRRINKCRAKILAGKELSER